MTRINLIDPSLLTDQHLMAEYRELPMVHAALRRSLKTLSAESILKRIPSEYTLNKGHVLFHYDKGYFLKRRYELLQAELRKREFNIDENRGPGLIETDERFMRDYVPTKEAISINVERIKQRIMLKPSWYRYNRETLTVEKLNSLLSRLERE